MKFFTSGQRVIITDPVIIPAMQGRSGMVESVITSLTDTKRGNAAIVRMDDPAQPGLSFRYLMFYAAECSPLDPHQSPLF